MDCSNPLVFINYRRNDSATVAGRLDDHLKTHFGNTCVFFDINTIEGGTKFPEAIERAIDSSKVLIAVIGTEWLNKGNQERLKSEEDFVRKEIAKALKSEIRVIPVLINGASMPSKEELPIDLEDLSSRNAIHVKNETFRRDVEPLIQTIQKIIDPTLPSEDILKYKRRILLTGFSLVIILIAVFSFLNNMIVCSVPLSSQPVCSHQTGSGQTQNVGFCVPDGYVSYVSANKFNGASGGTVITIPGPYRGTLTIFEGQWCEPVTVGSSAAVQALQTINDACTKNGRISCQAIEVTATP